jgi:hypothetical protein
LQCARERNAIERTPEPIIVPAVLTLLMRNANLVTWIVQGDVIWYLSPKMHKGRRHSDTMQPSGQSRLSTKCGELSEHLNKYILGQVVRVRRVFGHAKDHRIYPMFVEAKQKSECIPVAIESSSYKTKI